MTSGVSWDEPGLSPELYQAAREAARSAGMSVEDWLKLTFGDSAPAGAKPQGGSGSGSISGRLEELSHRIGRPPGESAPAAPNASTVRGARLSDTVARLNARLEQLTSGRAAPAETAKPATPPRRDPSPPSAPESFDRNIDEVVAEIAARQRALDAAPEAAPASIDSEAPPALSAPDLTSLERQLTRITEQIESLRRPCALGDSLEELRSDLAHIGRAIDEAMPRRALETLHDDVHALAERIGAGYGRGGDPSALENIEHGLAQVHAALNSMTPAEGLAGFDQRISELSRKLDSFAGGAPDPETLRYLEAAINELRELSAGVASAEGVALLAGEVQALGTRIDHISETTGATGLDSLARRVGELTQALDTRVAEIGPLPPNLEVLVKSLTDKLNKSESPGSDQAAFAALERQISGLADKIEEADHKFSNLSTIERGIQQLTLQVREAREDAIATAERVARTIAADVAAASTPKTGVEVTAIKHDLASLHQNQAESDQRTQDTLEAVHDTLERLVERLAMVETDIRDPHAAEPTPAREPMPFVPDLPATIPQAPPPGRPAVSMTQARSERPPIDPDLPADTPLEPGSAGRGRSPAERIAASEAALGPLKRDTPEVTGKANFIAAARRAAQAAANEGNPVEGQRAEEHKDEETPTSMIGRFLANRRRALMVGVSALLVLYGTIQVVGMIGSSDNAEPPRPTSQSQAVEPRKMAAPAPAPAAAPAAPKTQAAADPLIAPTPTASLIAPAPIPAPAAILPPPAAPAIQAVAATPAADTTGSIKPPLDLAALSAQPSAEAPHAAQAGDRLPASIGGPALRTAAANGNPAAEYEIAVRFAEGRGVPANLELAVQWFERAAKQGLAPAQYRLGSLHEKGQGVKKDLDKARQLYLAAADKGNAKAVHNLAVLYAEGIDGKPDYRTASQWFRKAADRGVADSQYNLGILYARGIGVDQNLAESYKWFALAAQQGDQDAGKKRDDVAGRLDQQSLVAAKLAVQTWTADAPPDEAVNVKTPAGGWDRATATPAKPVVNTRRKPQST
jgi:localization factor PodJL